MITGLMMTSATRISKVTSSVALVMFSSMGDLASHSDNNHGGSRLFRTLKLEIDQRLRKGLEFLEVEFEGLDDSFEIIQGLELLMRYQPTF